LVVAVEGVHAGQLATAVVSVGHVLLAGLSLALVLLQQLQALASITYDSELTYTNMQGRRA
jgi:hypothetical protein